MSFNAVKDEISNGIAVVMFSPQFRPVVGGAERQVEKLAVALVRAGCSVTILTPRSDDNSPETEEIKGVIIQRFPLHDLSHRYPMHGIALLNVPYILWQVARAVAPYLKGANVLHCHLASLYTAGAAIAGRVAGVPVILKAATADQRSDIGELERTGASGPMMAWLVRSLIHTWVATTRAVKQALMRAGVAREKIASIPNGVEIPETRRTVQRFQRASRFLYLGRLSTNTQRDLPSLINAFDRLAEMHPDVQLAVIGGGDLLGETQELAASFSSRSRIHLPGFDDPEKWLAWADCFVLPSRREGLSNALLEAMAIGLPCIANDIPPNREVLADGEAGILVPVENIDSLVSAMQIIVEEIDIAEHFGEQALKRVEKFYSIDVVASEYVCLYRRLTV